MLYSCFLCTCNKIQVHTTENLNSENVKVFPLKLYEILFKRSRDKCKFCLEMVWARIFKCSNASPVNSVGNGWASLRSKWTFYWSIFYQTSHINFFDDFIDATQMIFYIHLHRRCTRRYHLLSDCKSLFRCRNVASKMHAWLHSSIG